jgi:hypothetical protein
MPLDEVSVRNETRSMIGSGTCLQELYISPHLLTQPMWGSIAESIKWLRAHPQSFADIHWVGGDPEALEAYGWAGWNDGHGVLTLRNPSDKPAVFKLDIVETLDLPPASLKTGYALTSPYPDQRLRSLIGKPAAWCEIELQPFEVLSFDVAAAEAAGKFDKDTYQEWRAEQDAVQQTAAAKDFPGSWTYHYKGRTYTRTFLADGSARLAIDGELFHGWSNSRWQLDGKRLIVTGVGAKAESHRLDAQGRLVMPSGLGLAEKQP